MRCKVQVMSSRLVRFVVVCVTMLGAANAALAQDDARGAVRPGEEVRIALVIGNSNYENAGFLPNPTNDAQAIADKLRELNFEVFLGLDLTKDNLDSLLQQYTRALDGADVGLFFYAGHGLQVDGINYMVPTDAVLERASDLDFEVVDANIVLRQFDRPDFTGLVFLDACRDNPLARSMRTGTRSIGRGLAEVSSATGTLIAYATQPGNVAYDGEGEHSPFTVALLNHIDTPDMEIRLMLDFVGEDVAEMTRGQQQPWVHFSRLRGGFYFNKAEEETPVADSGTTTDSGLNGADVAVNEDPAVRFYDSARTLENPQDRLLLLEQFIRLYPTHPLAVLAASEVQDLRNETRAPNPDNGHVDASTPNVPPRVDAARTLTLDADSGPTALEIGRPSDDDDDTLTITLMELPEAGMVRSAAVPVSVGQELPPGELAGLDYMPDPDMSGPVGALRYRVEDGRGGVTEGVLRITLRAPNQAPVVQDLLSLTFEQSEEPAALGITAPIDPDNDRLTIRVTWLPRAGLIELNGRPITRDEELTAYQLIALSYRADPERTGDMGSFEYQVDDGRGGLIRATVRISVTNPNTAPVVADETLVEVVADPDGVPLNLTPPTDPDGDSLTIRITWTPRWGSVMSGETVVSRGDELSVTQFGALRYFAAAGHDGDSGSFEFAVSDGRGDPVRGMVRISVTAPNQPPTMPASQDIVVLAEAGAARLVFEQPVDPNGDALEATVREIPFRGRLVAGGRTVRVGDVIAGTALDSLVYEPAIGHIGAAGQLSLAVNDGASEPVSALIRISVETRNSAPVVEEGRVVSVTAGAVTPLNIPLPRDPDGDAMTVRVLQVPNGGFVRLGSSVVRVGQTMEPAQLASLVFEMTGSELRANLLTYEADDGHGGVSMGSVALEVEEISIITAPPGSDLAGDTPEAAYVIGPMSGGSRVFQDAIDAIDIEDFYRVSFADWTEADITLTGLTGDLDLILLTADDRVAATSEQAGEIDEALISTVPAGTYYVRILGYESAESSYTLTVNARAGTPPPPDRVGNSPQTADLLRTPGGAAIIVSDRIDLTDNDDFYGFDVDDYTEVEVTMSGLGGDLDLELVDPSGTMLVGSQEGGTNDEYMIASVGPGRYYIHVYAYSGQSDYQLSIEGAPSAPPPPDNAGNITADAAALGVLRGSISFADWVGTADANDYLTFDLASPATLTARMTGLTADADIELLDANGEFLTSSNNVELQDEEIVIDLEAGRYFLHVYPFEGQTEYRLDLASAATTQGTEIRPAEPVAQLQAWENGWSRDERRQVQRALQLVGLYNSGIDGLFGNGTRTAIRAFQERLSEPATGYLSRDQRALLSVNAAEEVERRTDTAAQQARSAANAANAEVEAYESGDSYSGDRNRDGYGVYVWAGGHTYEGQWNGNRQGFGTLSLSDGWRYSGQWQDSVFVGFGVGIGPDGTRMIGEWNVAPQTLFSDGMNGYGQVVSPNGTVQRGYFRNGELIPD